MPIFETLLLQYRASTMMAVTAVYDEYESCIRGYHFYQSIWAPVIGEITDECARETDNRHDPYAVKVMKAAVAVGHLPRKISSVCSLFIRRGGTISCRVTGNRRYSRDLAQGGLDIPCVLIIEGDECLVNKVCYLLRAVQRV